MTTHNTCLPRWAYTVLAVLAAVIGLASSAVTAQFFVMGLQRVEPDTFARDALMAAGLLMVVTELAAFGLAALLPKTQLRALRWRLIACGMLLLAFEASTIYVTQVTLVKTGDAAAKSVSTRIADLRSSIDSRRAAAAGLRTNGERQSSSIHSWNRVAGAAALRESLEAEQQTEPMAQELARLEAQQQPTLSDVLGTRGMLAYSVARALLISLMGLVMFGAAGALLRCALSAGTASPPVAPPLAARVESTRPRYTSVPLRGAAFAVAAVPMSALAVPMATYAPPLPTPPFISVPAVLAQPQPVIAKQAQLPAQLKPSVLCEQSTASRYALVKDAVLAGRIKPSVRCIQAEIQSGTLVARRMLHQLAADAVIVRAGQGWARAAVANPNQLTLAGV